MVFNGVLGSMLLNAELRSINNSHADANSIAKCFFFSTLTQMSYSNKSIISAPPRITVYPNW